MKTENIYFKCSCGTSLAADAKETGMTISCPDCGQELKVPAPAHKLRCDCETTIFVPESMVGENIQCLTCKTSWEVQANDSDNDSNAKESYKGLFIKKTVGMLKNVKPHASLLILPALVSIVIVCISISIENLKSFSDLTSGATNGTMVLLDSKTQPSKSQSKVNSYAVKNPNGKNNDNFAIEINNNPTHSISDTITILTNKQVSETGEATNNLLNIAVKNSNPDQIRTDSNSWNILEEPEEAEAEFEVVVAKTNQCTNSQSAVVIAASRKMPATNINNGAKLKAEINHKVQKEKSVKPAFSDISDSLMIIEGETGRGSGFILLMKDKKYIITNRHVITGAKNLKVRSVNGYMPKIKSFELGVDADLVRMEIDENENVKFLVLSKTIDMKEPVAVYGNSEGIGVVTEIKGAINGVGPAVIETTAGFVSGNSGSPIMNKKGEVLGVATFATQNKMQDWVAQGTRFENVRRFGLRLDSVKWFSVSSNEFCNQNQLLSEAETYFSDLADIIIYCCGISNHKNGLNKKDECLSRTLSCYLTADQKVLSKRSRWSNELAHFVQKYDKISEGGMAGYSAYGLAKLSLQISATAPKKILKETKWIDNWFQQDANKYLDFIEFLSSNLDKYSSLLPVPHR